MTISSILLGIALASLTIFFIIRPFREKNTPTAPGRDWGPRHQLLEHKAAIYAAIKEIDADVQVGKLEPADHQVLRRRYLAEGVAVLEAIEAQPTDDPVDAAIKVDLERWSQGQGYSSTAYCPDCEAPADSGDKFCAKCGARLGG